MVGESGIFWEQAAPVGGVDFNTSYHMGFLDMPAIDMEPSLQGDCNLDGRVDINDLTIVLSHYGLADMTWKTGDLVGNGTVDINDLTIVLAHYGQTAGSATAGCGVSAVPEPSALALLALAFLALLVCVCRRPHASRSRLPGGTSGPESRWQACRYTQTNRYVPISPAPEGRPRIAQRFIAGEGREKPRKSRRDGRNSARKVTVRPSLRDLRRSIFPIHPAVNCWAIVERPYGTDACCDLCITTSSASGTYAERTDPGEEGIG